VSLREIVSALPNLDRSERRELAQRIFDFADEETALLADCDRQAAERFLILEKLEAQDGETDTGRRLDG